ncbi:hypothetical protein [Methanonatronarchaeum sp. AMET-Sl]|uniref:hypothetical protein n=1 Tax=Methanonatronarchaeum sp. AMET-Sl TaxID=3037654 RepID=UPI00244D9F31|nr:hypothetical protein [Methanonatronarchaeum sp. AMET-Sl]WGI18055.1 hypothetical protein QEN48_03380 [Methanonatronarchaeum sp. AMET-Sl]
MKKFEDGWVEGEENGLDRVFDCEDDFGESDIQFKRIQVILKILMIFFKKE